ncbi:hypothetical protein DKX38_008961 [Salix brachista]|uniref:t-SNARE coiled-coil homology domain-containing protein n=1 Tax=Salix brachista TaxID=2182728 RepID=A0A5N5M9D9_9ROSI|nr:hypothetical protein DKX38_008961 [Salix brachista]
MIFVVFVAVIGAMATPSGSWMQEFNEASKLGDEINGTINGKNSSPPSGSETQRHLSATRRKITILRTKLDILQSLLTALPSKQPISGKEMNRCQDMLRNLSTKVNQMATTLNMSSAANRENLCGPDKKTDDIVNRASGLDNHGLIFNLICIKNAEQDEGLEKLEETVTSTKHIALAVNEELTLHTKLLDDLDEHVDVTNSRLQVCFLVFTLAVLMIDLCISTFKVPELYILNAVICASDCSKEIGFSEQTHQRRLLLLDLTGHRHWEMASPSESWMQEFNEASKLGDEISAMISGKNSLPQPGPETQRQFSAVRRKATILRTKLDILKSLLSALPSKQPISAKEMNRRQEMLKNLSTKVNQMAAALNMFSAATRENLLGPDSKTDDIINRASGFDNQGLVEQDEGLDKLEETVISTKHIALAVNEELTLHTRLLDDLDEHVDVTNSRLQRVQKNLAFLNKRTKGIGLWFLLAEKMGVDFSVGGLSFSLIVTKTKKRSIRGYSIKQNQVLEVVVLVNCQSKAVILMFCSSTVEEIAVSTAWIAY